MRLSPLQVEVYLVQLSPQQDNAYLVHLRFQFLVEAEVYLAHRLSQLPLVLVEPFLAHLLQQACLVLLPLKESRLELVLHLSKLQDFLVLLHHPVDSVQAVPTQDLFSDLIKAIEDLCPTLKSNSNHPCSLHNIRM